ncbi:hypothetical protein ZWY2020_032968 [Hordeum vulgare]|nr:hypothetical protein ZWY2020_032968 [Hordeum vulgare]
MGRRVTWLDGRLARGKNGSGRPTDGRTPSFTRRSDQARRARGLRAVAAGPDSPTRAVPTALTSPLRPSPADRRGKRRWFSFTARSFSEAQVSDWPVSVSVSIVLSFFFKERRLRSDDCH